MRTWKWRARTTLRMPATPIWAQFSRRRTADLGSITSTTLGINGCINWSWRNGSRPNRECSIPFAWQARERVRQKTVAVPGATLTSWRRSVTPIIEDTKRCWNGSVANSIQRDVIWSQLARNFGTCGQESPDLVLTPVGIEVANNEYEGSGSMRFPEDKIKEAILHPDLESRDRATRTLKGRLRRDDHIGGLRSVEGIPPPEPGFVEAMVGGKVVIENQS